MKLKGKTLLLLLNNDSMIIGFPLFARSLTVRFLLLLFLFWKANEIRWVIPLFLAVDGRSTFPYYFEGAAFDVKRNPTVFLHSWFFDKRKKRTAIMVMVVRIPIKGKANKNNYYHCVSQYHNKVKLIVALMMKSS